MEKKLSGIKLIIRILLKADPIVGLTQFNKQNQTIMVINQRFYVEAFALMKQTT